MASGAQVSDLLLPAVSVLAFRLLVDKGEKMKKGVREA